MDIRNSSDNIRQTNSVYIDRLQYEYIIVHNDAEFQRLAHPIRSGLIAIDAKVTSVPVRVEEILDQEQFTYNVHAPLTTIRIICTLVAREDIPIIWVNAGYVPVPDPNRLRPAPDPIVRYVPNAFILRMLWRLYLSQNAPMTVPERPEAVHYLMPFSFLSTFEFRYAAYLADPDIGVGIQGPGNVPNLGRDEIDPVYLWSIQVCEQNGQNANEIVAMAGNGQFEIVRPISSVLWILHCIALTVYKAFNPEGNNQHMREFVGRRLQPFNASNGTFNIDAGNVFDVAAQNFINQTSSTLARYPKLRYIIMTSIIESREPQIQHTLSLLAYTGMTSVSIILSFLETPNKTRAHIHPIIFQQSINFFITIIRLRRQYGENNTSFVRLLDPTFTGLDTRNWPELAIAAHRWESRGDQNPLQAYRVLNSKCRVPNLSRLLATHLPPEVLVDGQANQIQGMLNGYRNIVRGFMGYLPDEFDANRLEHIHQLQAEDDEFNDFQRQENNDRGRLVGEDFQRFQRRNRNIEVPGANIPNPQPQQPVNNQNDVNNVN